MNDTILAIHGLTPDKFRELSMTLEAMGYAVTLETAVLRLEPQAPVVIMPKPKFWVGQNVQGTQPITPVYYDSGGTRLWQKVPGSRVMTVIEIRGDWIRVLADTPPQFPTGLWVRSVDLQP